MPSTTPPTTRATASGCRCASTTGCSRSAVEDNGAGYPQALLDAGAAGLSGVASGIDFRTNSAGLGLYFSREVARMHRHRGREGSVRLENGGALGGGCFILSLP